MAPALLIVKSTFPAFIVFGSATFHSVSVMVFAAGDADSTALADGLAGDAVAGVDAGAVSDGEAALDTAVAEGADGAAPDVPHAASEATNRMLAKAAIFFMATSPGRTCRYVLTSCSSFPQPVHRTAVLSLAIDDPVSRVQWPGLGGPIGVRCSGRDATF